MCRVAPVLITIITVFFLSEATRAADPVTLTVPGRRDFVFDRNGVLYITAAASIERYDAVHSASLSPWPIGGDLNGIDLSADGKTLAVADQTVAEIRNRIVLIETSSGESKPVRFTRSFHLEGGAYMVAWGYDGSLLITSTFKGSGHVPLRRYDLKTDKVSVLQDVQEDSMLTPSADRRTIAIAEGNTSSGQVLSYDVAKGAVTDSAKTHMFIDEVAVDRRGVCFVVPTSNGAYVYPSGLKNSNNPFQILGSNSWGPQGAVFSPKANMLFTADSGSVTAQNGVKVWDTDTWEVLATIDPCLFDQFSANTFESGRIEISPDGRWLAVSIGEGVRIYDVSPYTVVKGP